MDYDCPQCGNQAISVALLHTDLSWDELSKQHVQTAVCNNGFCPQKGLLQKLKPSRVILGALNSEPSHRLSGNNLGFGGDAASLEALLRGGSVRIL